MSGPVPNAKPEHLLIHYFLANGPNHKVRIIFNEDNLYNYDNFLEYDKQQLLGMRRQKYNVRTPFNSRKINLINDVLLYYQFMRNNNNEVMVENPDQWVREFKDWRDLGKPKSIAAFTPKQKQ